MAIYELHNNPIKKSNHGHLTIGTYCAGKEGTIVGATKLRHVDGMLGAVNLELSDDEIRYLSEPYAPHSIVGVLAQNTPEAANKKQVWNREIEK